MFQGFQNRNANYATNKLKIIKEKYYKKMNLLKVLVIKTVSFFKGKDRMLNIQRKVLCGYENVEKIF